MKKPRPQDFDPSYKEKKPFKPEEVDLSGVIAIKPKPVPSTKSRSPVVTESRTSEVSKSVSPEVTKLRTYELRNFDQLRRLDLRVTYEQKRYLDDLEEVIRQEMPEGEQGNPEFKRITKNSIIRVFIEIFRQLDLRLKANRFRNENDLLSALFDSMQKELTNSGSSGVTK